MDRDEFEVEPSVVPTDEESSSSSSANSSSQSSSQSSVMSSALLLASLMHSSTMRCKRDTSFMVGTSETVELELEKGLAAPAPVALLSEPGGDEGGVGTGGCMEVEGRGRTEKMGDARAMYVSASSCLPSLYRAKAM